MRWRWLFLLLACGLVGCREQPTIQELTTALNDANLSNCLLIQATIPPYGRIVLYGRRGDLPCEEIWQHMFQFGQ
jgi:hypothetical protein